MLEKMVLKGVLGEMGRLENAIKTQCVKRGRDFKEHEYLLRMRWILLIIICTAKVSNAGTYVFQQGGSWGPSSGISVNLNQFYDFGTNSVLGVTGIGNGPGSVRFTTDSDSYFVLNSQGNEFYITNYLLISNLSDSAFIATVANSAIRLGQSISFGRVS